MKRWQPIGTVPLDTPVIVTDGRSRRIGVLKTQKPAWRFEDTANPLFDAANSLVALNASGQFVPTHWFSLPKLPEGK